MSDRTLQAMSVAARDSSSAPHPRHGDRQAGVVLLNALIVITVVAAIATTLMRSGLEGRNRYELMLRADQARSYARAAEALAAELLSLDAEASETDHLGEAWAEERGALEIEGALLTARLFDLQGRLNINAIVALSESDDANGGNGTRRTTLSLPQYTVLETLIRNAGGRPGLAPRLAEWVARQVDALPGAAGDTPYLRQQDPYLRPAGPLLSGRDIRLVDGLSADVFAELEPSLTALPGNPALNVNTAPRPVLEALMPGLAPVQMQRFLQDRRAEPFASRAAFETYVARLVAPQTFESLRALDLDVKTNWFLLEVTVEHGLGRARLYAVLERPEDGGRTRVALRSAGPL